jgi:EpsI family protein
VNSRQGVGNPKIVIQRPKEILSAAMFAAMMALTLLLADTLKPTQMLAQKRERMTLASVVPRQFGNWHARRNGEVALVSPDVGKVLAETYTETLSRTYSDEDAAGAGDTVMLSMAYGSQQKQGLRIHRQEVCYEAQGFKVDRVESIRMRIQGRKVIATRFEASNGPRVETVVYWFTMGDDIVHGYVDRQLTQLRYTLSGYVPDGYLFRASIIGPDVKQNAKVLERFVADFFSDTSKELNARIIGSDQSTGKS